MKLKLTFTGVSWLRQAAAQGFRQTTLNNEKKKGKKCMRCLAQVYSQKTYLIFPILTKFPASVFFF